MTSREVQRISGLAHDLRSYTGHQGSLFGSEKTFGYSRRRPLFNVAGDAVFDYMILGELRNASRQVLAKALGRPGLAAVSAPSRQPGRVLRGAVILRPPCGGLRACLPGSHRDPDRAQSSASRRADQAVRDRLLACATPDGVTMPGTA